MSAPQNAPADAAAPPADQSSGATTPQRPSPSPRVWFVDAMRLLASFQMVNGHTIGAVMPEAVRQGPIYDGYLWFRGMIAVAFLSVAGVAFYLSTLYRFEKHRSNPGAIRRRYKRGFIIVGVGFLLQLPAEPFASDPEVFREQWGRFFGIGVLGCIGFMLLLLETMTVLARRPMQVVWVSFVLGVAMVASAPYLDRTIADGQSHMLLNWVSHQGGSMFPLFPWGGYMLLGVALGRFMLPKGGHTPKLHSFLRVALVLVLVWSASEAATVVGCAWFDPARDAISTNPVLSLERLTAVLIFLTGFSVLCAPIRSMPRFLRILAAETLVIYTFHLIILFGPVIQIGWRLERKLTLTQSFLLSAAMIVTTCLFTLAWHVVRRDGWKKSLRRLRRQA